MRRYFLGTVIFCLAFVVATVGFFPGMALGQVKRVGLVMQGAVNDVSFGQAAYTALMKAKDKYGVQVSYQERVADADRESALRDYARQGYDLVIGHGFQFLDPAMKLSPQFPKVMFAVTQVTAAKPPNVASYRSRLGELGFLSGAFASLMSKKGTVGIIGGLKVPPIVEYMEGFKLGAAYVKPDAKVLTAWIGSFYDVAKGKEAAVALIEQGADVVAAMSDQSSLGIIKAAEERGIMVIGGISDQSSVSPDTVVTSAVVDMGIVLLVERLAKNDLQPINYQGGVAEGDLYLMPFKGFENKVPGEVKQRIEAIKQEIAAGKIKGLPAITK